MKLQKHFTGPCPICAGNEFKLSEVLWPKLVAAWQLNRDEEAYINRQQGFHCTACMNNLRSMSLAAAILYVQKFEGTLLNFARHEAELTLLEVNRAGQLTPVLSELRSHRLVEFPEFDMRNLDIESESYNLIIHSDTLEHISDPGLALTECYRITANDGACIFTVPIVVDRLSVKCNVSNPSYHDQRDLEAPDQLVHTEFGADVWKYALVAGFRSCEIFCLEYPAALTLICRK
jgi:SAM-dependent methyltransferase